MGRRFAIHAALEFRSEAGNPVVARAMDADSEQREVAVLRCKAQCQHSADRVSGEDNPPSALAADPSPEVCDGSPQDGDLFVEAGFFWADSGTCSISWPIDRDCGEASCAARSKYEESPGMR